MKRISWARTTFAALVVVVLSVSVLMPASTASAFCGFYVSGADASLYNNATMVVLMREGQRTVLSMQNNYQGPPADFAMVVPVPAVLSEDNVQTLPREIFDRIDQLAAPRLVEYWEQDPCSPRMEMMDMAATGAAPPMMARSRPSSDEDLGVTVEAQFSVAEYDIVILSATDSVGLDTWLRRENYNIPTGAETVLRPYVQAGTKFFVAKVDSQRVTFENGRAVLSPLRFYYDSQDFNLPVRLGLLNSAGQQDLIVHILARGQRYEVANYPNVAIPTNIRVVDAVRTEFGAWYDLLFRRTVATTPGAVVTEYSWDASSCDPCPVPPLEPGELATLGADVIGGANGAPNQGGMPRPGIMPPGRRMPFGVGGFVLTRLHYRYGREGLNEDLVFRPADAIVGGRGVPNQNGKLEEVGVQTSSMNNFQGRYAILHPWEGQVSCQNPQRGIWGGPPGGGEPQPLAARNAAMTGIAPGAAITSVGQGVADNILALSVMAGEAEAPLATDPGPPGGAPPEVVPRTDGPTPVPALAPAEGGCASCSVSPVAETGWRSLASLSLLVTVISVRRRRRRRA